MLATHGALWIVIVAFLALGGMWLMNMVFASRASRNAPMSKEHRERIGELGEEGLRRAAARHNEHE
jgi:cytochrome c-type biogenesis protein CcmH/NrfF